MFFICDTVKWWDVTKRTPTEMQGWMAIRNELFKKEVHFCEGMFFFVIKVHAASRRFKLQNHR